MAGDARMAEARPASSTSPNTTPVPNTAPVPYNVKGTEVQGFTGSGMVWLHFP